MRFPTRCLSSNQTVAGLKYGMATNITITGFRSNQTVAGLKYEAGIEHRVYDVAFKSDRCGIEM